MTPVTPRGANETKLPQPHSMACAAPKRPFAAAMAKVDRATARRTEVRIAPPLPRPVEAASLAHPAAHESSRAVVPSPSSHGTTKPREKETQGASTDDPPTQSPLSFTLDPLERALYVPHVRVEAPPPIPMSAPNPPPPLDLLVDRFLKRFAMSGGKRRGAARLEIGAGGLEGAAITFDARDGGVHVTIDAPPGVDASSFAEGVRTRLRARGLDVDVDVR